ncbi:MAG: hypothetical protein MJZ99_05625, partial [Bacteroidales bacterium]|nr:hypothetical protein [Bacteroidales bacterium]
MVTIVSGSGDRGVGAGQVRIAAGDGTHAVIVAENSHSVVYGHSLEAGGVGSIAVDGNGAGVIHIVIIPTSETIALVCDCGNGGRAAFEYVGIAGNATHVGAVGSYSHSHVVVVLDQAEVGAEGHIAVDGNGAGVLGVAIAPAIKMVTVVSGSGDRGVGAGQVRIAA